MLPSKKPIKALIKNGLKQHVIVLAEALLASTGH